MTPIPTVSVEKVYKSTRLPPTIYDWLAIAGVGLGVVLVGKGMEAASKKSDPLRR